jgi:4-carboxymuconolactone decarboxylase
MPPIPEHPSRRFRITEAEMTLGQSDLVRRIIEGPRKDLPVNMEIWLHSTRFAELANDFAEYVGHLAPKTKRLKEIAILVVASGLNSAFEWFWHERLGKQLGLTPEQLAALRDGSNPVFEDETEQVTCDLARAMVLRQGVDQDLHERAIRLLGRDGVADLIGLLGLYVMVAYSLDFYEVPVPSSSEAA